MILFSDNVHFSTCERPNIYEEICTEVDVGSFATETGEWPALGERAAYITSTNDSTWVTKMVSDSPLCTSNRYNNIKPLGQVKIEFPDLCNEQ